MIKLEDLLVLNKTMNSKNTVNRRTGITYSVLTSGTDSGGTMCDAASADCEISTLFNDTTSSKLERISAICSPSYNSKYKHQ